MTTMTPDELRIAVAEEMGLDPYWCCENHSETESNKCPICSGPVELTSGTKFKPIPNLTLDWIHECEKTLTDEEWEQYLRLLSKGITKTWWEGCKAIRHASATEAAIAFLMVKGRIK